jgi:hypothetical protein
MFHPFRNEYKEITTKDLRLKFENIEKNELELRKLESQIQYYQPYQELLNGIEAYIQDHQEDEENDESEEYEDNCENEGDDDLKLETTGMKDIEDFIKDRKEVTRETGLLDKESFQN